MRVREQAKTTENIQINWVAPEDTQKTCSEEVSI